MPYIIENGQNEITQRIWASQDDWTTAIYMGAAYKYKCQPQSPVVFSAWCYKYSFGNI